MPLARQFAQVPVVLALIVLAMVGFACQPEEVEYSLEDLPPGDAARGADLYTTSIDGSPACSDCHAVDGRAKSGPSLDGYAVVAGDRVDSQDADEYTLYSILRPAQHTTQGYSNVMYDEYEDKLSQQQIADLIAYLLTL